MFVPGQSIPAPTAVPVDVDIVVQHWLPWVTIWPAMVPTGKIIILSARTPQQCATNHLTPPVVVGVMVGVGVNVFVGVGVGVGVGHGFVVRQLAQVVPYDTLFQVNVAGPADKPEIWWHTLLMSVTVVPIANEDGTLITPPAVPQQAFVKKNE